uniref:Uncharacterized protein n=1 Tax=Peronospora matthiolae TaxID=2874970 RepID=A0AAV1UU09_9STRA
MLNTNKPGNFGNRLDADKLSVDADVDARGGFDLQTVTYRARKVVAGLLLCSSMMCGRSAAFLGMRIGNPLHKLPPSKTQKQALADIMKIEDAKFSG